MVDQKDSRSQSGSSAASNSSLASSASSMASSNQSRPLSVDRRDSCTHVFNPRRTATGEGGFESGDTIYHNAPPAGQRNASTTSLNNTNLFFSGLDWLLDEGAKKGIKKQSKP